MPSKSPAQHRLMEAASHDPAIAAQTGVPAGVAKEYVNADKRKAALKRLAARRARAK